MDRGAWRATVHAVAKSRTRLKQLSTTQPAQHSLEGLMIKLKLQCFGHLRKRANSLEKTLMLGKTEGKRRRGWKMMKWLDNITDSMGMSLSKLQETVKDREAWHVTVHGVAKGRTLLSNNKITCVFTNQIIREHHCCLNSLCER